MLENISGHAVALAILAASLAATVHILLNKQDVRAAIGWMAVAWLVPGIGAVLYLLLGINRIRRGAERRLREQGLAVPGTPGPFLGPELAEFDPSAPPRLGALARLASALTGLPLTAGNRLDILAEGDAAYPAMLTAIEGARHSLCLSTYIFGRDAVGEAFAEALCRAVARGVEVRVLVDAMGSLGIAGGLRRRGIAARAFNPPGLRQLSVLNLRTHRKLLVADGRLAVTGGMNLRAVHRSEGSAPPRARDLMFAIEGPVVAQLVRVFAEDWKFAAGEDLEGPLWYPDPGSCEGGAIARVVPDGPEGEVSKVGWIFDGAISLARDEVLVATPYFLPGDDMLSALAQAALRGVAVHLLVPERTNYRLVDWASRAVFPLLLDHGCQVWLTPEPFDHAKLVAIDRQWAMIGSSNWDNRSLRLNFELNVEVYDAGVAGRLAGLLDERRAAARPLMSAELDARLLASRLRDRAARLMSPYL